MAATRRSRGARVMPNNSWRRLRSCFRPLLTGHCRSRDQAVSSRRSSSCRRVGLRMSHGGRGWHCSGFRRCNPRSCSRRCHRLVACSHHSQSRQGQREIRPQQWQPMPPLSFEMSQLTIAPLTPEGLSQQWHEIPSIGAQGLLQQKPSPSQSPLGEPEEVGAPRGAVVTAGDWMPSARKPGVGSDGYQPHSVALKQCVFFSALIISLVIMGMHRMAGEMGF